MSVRTVARRLDSVAGHENGAQEGIAAWLSSVVNDGMDRLIDEHFA